MVVGTVVGSIDGSLVGSTELTAEAEGAPDSPRLPMYAQAQIKVDTAARATRRISDILCLPVLTVL
jgi:hypothetical protein